MYKKTTTLLFIFLIIGSIAFAGNDGKYTFIIDLTNTKDDKLFVELIAPKITEDEIVYYLPKMIPGTYRIADYGRFVSEIKAYDKKGNTLEVTRLDDNSWKISKAKKLVKLTYWVEDIIDSEIEGEEIYVMAATNIEADKNYVLNMPGFLGYFEDKTNMPYDLNVIRRENLYGATGLIPNGTNLSTIIGKEGKALESGSKMDSYSVENYDRLVDSPIMYSVADTAIIKVANSEVLVSAYSPNNMITAKEIATTIEKVLLAQNEYLGGKLPVDKYAFIFYFTDQPISLFGALEHSYSSFYYMPENSIDRMQQTLNRFAAHEFFHIVTPLNIHSEEVQFFDFNNPKMSKHLWLYEGMTENFANNVQVKYDIISPETYLQIMRQKMIQASHYDENVSFTELSLGALDEHADLYNNVYEKGALIGMCLDILLRDLSDGKYGAQELMRDLSSKYGKDKPFKDDELFSIITEMTYPQVGEFFTKYVEGTEPLPYVELFNKVGITYSPKVDNKGVDLGISERMVGFNPKDGTLFIQNEDGLNEFGKAIGFKNGDVLKQINGQDMPPVGGQQFNEFIDARMAELIVGNKFSYTVVREGKEMLLESNVIEVDKPILYQITLDENATDRQMKIRNSWLKAEK